MKKIGVTGGIGSGKSLVCEIFRNLGAPIFNADEQAKKLLETDLVKEFYSNQFGNSVFTQGILDKRKIAGLIFTHPDALAKVNGFIHPLVFQLFQSWQNQYSESKYVIHETALLFESNAKKELDYTIVVLAPPELRIRRVMERDKISEQAVLQRMKNQISVEKATLLADFIIHNDADSLLIPQVLNIHEKLIL
jgi:dephospho-CoA kinase